MVVFIRCSMLFHMMIGIFHVQFTLWVSHLKCAKNEDFCHTPVLFGLLMSKLPEKSDGNQAELLHGPWQHTCGSWSFRFLAVNGVLFACLNWFH